MTVEWMPRAEAQADEIAENLRIRSPDRAFQWVTDLLELVENLERFPQMGRIIPERQNPALRELIFEKQYRVMYRVTADKVQILAVKHGRQDFDL